MNPEGRISWNEANVSRKMILKIPGNVRSVKVFERLLPSSLSSETEHGIARWDNAARETIN